MNKRDVPRDADTPCDADTPVGAVQATSRQECRLHHSVGAVQSTSRQECRRHGGVVFRGLHKDELLHIRQDHLPHWQQDGACYFVTFRLGDSLPQHLVAKWLEERQIWMRHNPKPWAEEQRREYDKLFTKRQMDWMDAGYGECHLRRSEVRAMVQNSIMKFYGVRYDVDCFVLMPNHVHLVWQLRSGFDLSVELKGLKGSSARACNLLVGKSGTFWMDESYDRIMRDFDELNAFRKYIENNPRKAGLQPHEFTLEMRNVLEEE